MSSTMMIYQFFLCGTEPKTKVFVTIMNESALNACKIHLKCIPVARIDK